MSKARILYWGLVGAAMAGLLLARVYAGDPNPDPLAVGALMVL